MNTPNDGGNAFPLYREEGDGYGGVVRSSEFGMTLRDYFAAQSLAGQMASYANQDNIASVEQMAKWNYTIADAMLAERSKPISK